MTPPDDPATESKLPAPRSRREVDPSRADAPAQLNGRDNHRQVDEIGDELSVKHELGAQWTRLEIFGTVLLGVAIDLVFLIVWASLQQGAHYAFDLLGKLPGMTGIIRQTLEYVFDFATLTVVVAYISRDLWLSIRRIWRTK